MYVEQATQVRNALGPKRVGRDEGEMRASMKVEEIHSAANLAVIHASTRDGGVRRALQRKRGSAADFFYNPITVMPNGPNRFSRALNPPRHISLPFPF